MSRKLYVGNLDYNATEVDLEGVFLKFGTIESVRVIRDHETDRSRGFGFVNFREDKSGVSALDEMNNSDILGRQINVRVANDRNTVH